MEKKTWQEIADELERAQAERVEALEKAKAEFLEEAVYPWLIPLVYAIERALQRVPWLWRWLNRG